MDSADGFAAGVGAERVQRPLVFFVLVVAEDEELAANERPARPQARVAERERAGIHRPALGFGTDEVFAAHPVIDRGVELVGAAAGDAVNRGPDEAALAHVERRDADLYLLERFEGDRGDVGALAGLRAETEGVVEVRTVDRDVVEAVVLPRERVAARLRRESGDRFETSGNCRERRDVLAADRRCGTCSRRREDGVAHGCDFNLLGDGDGFHGDVDVTGHAEVDADVLDGLRREGRAAGAADVDDLNGVGTADTHRRD